MDPANDRSWIKGIREAVPLTPPPVGVGTRVRRVASFLGRRMEYTMEVTELVTGERLVMRTKVPFDMTVTYAMAESEGGTLFSVRVQGGGSGFYKLAAPLLNGQVKRGITQDVRLLKTVLERKGSEPRP